MAAALLDEFAQTMYLLDGVFYKLLSAESWVHAHQQHHIHIADDIFQDIYRSRRIECYASLHTSSMNLLDGTV